MAESKDSSMNEYNPSWMWEPEQIRNWEDRKREFAPADYIEAKPKRIRYKYPMVRWDSESEKDDQPVSPTKPKFKVESSLPRPESECTLTTFKPEEWDPRYKGVRSDRDSRINAWVPYSQEELARGEPKNAHEMDDQRLIYEAYRTKRVREWIHDDEIAIVHEYSEDERRMLVAKYWELRLHYMEEIDYRIKSGNKALAARAEAGFIHPKQWDY